MSMLKVAVRAVGVVLMFWVAFAPTAQSQAPAFKSVPVRIELN